MRLGEDAVDAENVLVYTAKGFYLLLVLFACC